MQIGRSCLAFLFFFLVAVQSVQAGNLVLLTENFDDITTLDSAGWVQFNHSEPLGSTNWFQGNSGVFPAQEGADTSYIGANYNNAGGSGTISNWLISPPLDLSHIDQISFWTRGPALSGWPDRLEVRLSTKGTSTYIGTTSTDVGDFTTLLLSINPNLLLSTYPEVWTEQVIDNIKAGGTGRIAFRYFVTNGGPSGSNANYIGIDTVTITASKFPWPMYLPAISGRMNK